MEDLRKVSDLESNPEDKTALCEQTEQTYKQSIDLMNEKEQLEQADADKKKVQELQTKSNDLEDVLKSMKAKAEAALEFLTVSPHCTQLLTLKIVEVVKIIEATIAEATAGPKLEGSDYLAQTRFVR